VFAALDVLTGSVIGRCLPRHRHVEFLKFLRTIDREVPKGLQIHLILDNYATPNHPNVKAWLAKHPRFELHFTPTSTSWLNLLEIFFSAHRQSHPPRDLPQRLRMLGLTGRLADGWLPSLGANYLPPEDAAKAHAAIDEAPPQSRARDPAKIERAVNVMALDGEPAGWPDQLARLARELRFSTPLVTHTPARRPARVRAPTRRGHSTPTSAIAVRAIPSTSDGTSQ
jgi:hypothetical protein